MIINHHQPKTIQETRESSHTGSRTILDRPFFRAENIFFQIRQVCQTLQISAKLCETLRNFPRPFPEPSPQKRGEFHPKSGGFRLLGGNARSSPSDGRHRPHPARSRLSGMRDRRASSRRVDRSANEPAEPSRRPKKAVGGRSQAVAGPSAPDPKRPNRRFAAAAHVLRAPYALPEPIATARQPRTARRPRRPTDRPRNGQCTSNSLLGGRYVNGPCHSERDLTSRFTVWGVTGCWCVNQYHPNTLPTFLPCFLRAHRSAAHQAASCRATHNSARASRRAWPCCYLSYVDQE